MKRPLAARHLARLHELVSSASICRTAVERELVDSAAVTRAAGSDRSTLEEIVAVARERGWSLPEPEPYGWSLMAANSDVRPRILRVVDRDIFELEGMARDTDDDDVASLALQLLSERRNLKRDLEQERPSLALPGAK